VHAHDALTAEGRPTLIEGQLFDRQFHWSYVSSRSGAAVIGQPLNFGEAP
jgi:hypothetical protein